MKSLFVECIWNISENRKKFMQGMSLLAILFVVFLITNKIVVKISQEKNIAIVQTWRPTASNFVFSSTKRDKGNISKYITALDKRILPPEGFYFAKYTFTIKSSGEYNIFWTGSPLGTIKDGNIWFSPFWMSFDNGPFEHFTEERKKKDYPYHPVIEYNEGKHRIEKLTTIKLTKGVHTLELKIDEPRKIDGLYFLPTDSIFFIKEGVKPTLRHFKKFPKIYFK